LLPLRENLTEHRPFVRNHRNHKDTKFHKAELKVISNKKSLFFFAESADALPI